ncbi:MAG: hypothetical protein SGJ27_13585 [Candidatus Melainabacteria bacterium]|nr:hypothetical protein [Candidatus Melainabacteria bacterium]
MNRGQKARIWALAISVFVAWALPQSAWAGTAFESGREEFRLKRFWAAKAKFMTAVTQEPGNQKAYLYLGRCLEYLRETEDAQATYRACFSVNPFSEDGKRAKAYSMDIAGRMEASDHRAVDDPQQVINSGLLIQRQALDLQARKVREAEAYYRSRRNVNRRSGNFYSNSDLLGRSGDVSNRRFIDQSHQIYDFQNEANKARLHGQRSAQSVQDSANALIERIGRKSGPNSNPALRALGTNLYVQYFRSKNEEEDIPPPPDPPIELRAKQLKFNDIPRAWRAQSKIFKFPTITAEDFLAPKKPKTLNDALVDDIEAPAKTVTKSASIKNVPLTPEQQIKNLDVKPFDITKVTPAENVRPSIEAELDELDADMIGDPPETPKN